MQKCSSEVAITTMSQLHPKMVAELAYFITVTMLCITYFVTSAKVIASYYWKTRYQNDGNHEKGPCGLPFLPVIVVLQVQNVGQEHVASTNLVYKNTWLRFGDWRVPSYGSIF